MRIRLALVVAALGITMAQAASAQPFPVATPEAVGMSSQRLYRIAPVLRADIESGRLPGAVVAIARRGRLVYYEAFGYLDTSAGTPMPRDAIFGIASMTKPLATVGALLLVEEGRMLLGDPIEVYLPEMAGLSVAVLRPGSPMITEPARRQPTIQDLMRHTAGFTLGTEGTSELHRIYLSGSAVSADSLNGAEFISSLAALPLHFQPGTAWGYGFGLDILGLAIERVTSQPLSRFLGERLFTPLGMVDTGFLLPAHKAGRFAKPLPVDPVTGNGQTLPDFTRPAKFDCGGACAYSTATDYLQFAQMLLDQGRHGDTRILSRKTVEYMTSEQLGPEMNIDQLRNRPNINGYGFGLSVAVRRDSGVSAMLGSPGDYHWGGAYGTFFWVDPVEELAVVFMAATPSAVRLHYRQLITSLVLQAVDD